MVKHTQFLQEVGSLLLQRVDFILVLVPQGVAGRTRLVLPPGLVAPPPPFPISRVGAEPGPVLDVSCVYFRMGFPQVRVYLLLQPDYLLGYDCCQPGSDSCQVLLTSLKVLLDLSDRHGYVAAGTPSRKVHSLQYHTLDESHGLKFLPAEGTLTLVFMDDPLLDAGQAEGVLAVDETGTGHELEADGACEFLV